MSINPYHTAEEINGVKCSVVEKNITEERALFLKALLEYNGLTVMIGEVAAKPAKPAAPDADPPPPAPKMYMVGVTSITFNPMYALYSRKLKTSSGKIVTPAYWKQEEMEIGEEEWYWKGR